MTRVLQQGHADGLCGLYAVLNFLNRTDWKDTPPNGLWYLLDACRHFGWFTPQHLTEGFEDHQLKAILDLQFSIYRMPFVSYFLSDVVKAQGNATCRSIFERVVSKGGSVVAQNQGGRHWVLVTGERGLPVVYDSGDAKRSVKSLSERRLSADSDWGVVILPHERPSIQVDL